MSNISSSSEFGPTGESFGFDGGIARHVGVAAAIMFSHIVYWLRFNSKTGRNLIDGKTWMYESIPKMAEFLEFLSEKQIKTAISVLVQNGYLIEGNHAKNPFNRTTWYSVPDESWIRIKGKVTKSPVGPMDNPHRDDPESPQGSSSVYIQDNTKVTTTTEPAAPVAAAPSVFECLKDIDIPIYDKEWLTANRTEKSIKHAIDWMNHPLTKVTQTRQQALKWASEVLPPIPVDAVSTEKKQQQQQKEDRIEANRVAFIEFRKKAWESSKEKGIYLEDKVSYCHIGNDQIYYDNLKFPELVKHSLIKCGLKPT